MWSIYCVYISKWSLWKPSSLLAHKGKHYNSAGSLSLICGQGLRLLRGCCRYFCSIPSWWSSFAQALWILLKRGLLGAFISATWISLCFRETALGWVGCHGLHCRYLIILDHQALAKVLFPFWGIAGCFIDRLCTYRAREEQSVCVAGERKFGPGTARSVSVLDKRQDFSSPWDSAEVDFSCWRRDLSHGVLLEIQYI